MPDHSNYQSNSTFHHCIVHAPYSHFDMFLVLNNKLTIKIEGERAGQRKKVEKRNIEKDEKITKR